MAKATIQIDRLTVRMKGVSPAVGRASVSGLGEALLEELGKRSRGSQRNRAGFVRNLRLPPISTERLCTPAEIRSAVVSSCADAIAAKLGDRSGG